MERKHFEVREAGLSRSPGVAAALSRIYYGDDGLWGEYDFPNSLLFRRLVDEHRKREQKFRATR